MDKIDYLVLLRGINVGGKNRIKMNEHKKIFEKMNFSNIETFIQTGNVLLKDYEIDKMKLSNKIEKVLSKEMQNEIKVAILTLSDLENVINGIPKKFGEENEKYAYDIMYDGKKVFYAKRVREKLTGSYIAQIINKWPNITVWNLRITKKLYDLMLERNKKAD